jgi:lipopolysaccharide/colanic/teichoic acid biosynthesis glycosyltransferase
MIALERKRTERSQKPFLLMLLETGDSLESDDDENLLSKVLSALSDSIRETDVSGWYKGSSVVGVMFTQLGSEDRTAIVSMMLARVSATLRVALGAEQLSQVSISFHLFPEDWDHEVSDRASNPALYPDLLRRNQARKLPSAVKRIMDVVGSALALVVLAPLFLVIAVAIKLSSKGPVFFRQQRIGQYGVPFVFLKFRSMYANNDASVHKQYIRELIRGQAERKPSNGNGQGVYKLTSDARITPVGGGLRRTSLDELPQFFNVLRGEMSLVGPRPPIAYEVKAYDIWHRSRLCEAKPGITGLWQVNGRSRVKFDDMVRLDFQYARTWSLLLDLKILMQTPKAVVLGEGAH